MLVVVSTLLAVLIGGGVTYFVQSRLDESRGERERERDREAAQHEAEHQEAAAARERKREEAADAAELQVAKRLLLEELDTLALHYALLVQRREYPEKLGAERQRLAFPTDTWESYKPTLARGLVGNDWEALSRFMHTISRVRAIVLEAEPNSPIPHPMVEQLRTGALMARDLHELLGGEPAPSVNQRGEPGDVI